MRAWLATVGLAALLLPVAATAHDGGYPTVARTDYVFACMQSNGQSRQIMEQCACSIDLIASILPYDRYVEADSVMRMRHVGGEKGALFRTSPKLREIVAGLKRAQAEAEMRCF